jgi:hypothetical protein
MTVYLTINTCSNGKYPLDPPGLPYLVSIYPNPATDQISVELSAVEEASVDGAVLLNTASAKPENYTIQLWSEQLGLVRTVEMTGLKQQISLQSLSKGMYFVHLLKNKEIVDKQKFWIK